MNWCSRTFLSALVMSASLLGPSSAARADLILGQLIVELVSGQHARADVEAWNNGPDRMFVAIDPREVTNPGTSSESSRNDPDPDKLGLLVSPARMILEPGQRRLIRIGSLATNDRERVYRVTVKPVVGTLSSEGSGLKVLVGYDMLILVRPPELKPHVSGTRSGNQLTLYNDGNVSVELVDGKQCDQRTNSCQDLPGGRLYSGAKKVIELAGGRTAAYKLRVGSKLIAEEF